MSKGELKPALEDLSRRIWLIPTKLGPRERRFGVSTLERWYHQARREKTDPVDALSRKRRHDAGLSPMMGQKLREAAIGLYNAHKTWSVEVLYKNLETLAKNHPEFGTLPSYRTVCRFFRSQGLVRHKKVNRRHTAGALAAEARLAAREVRSYEVEYVNALWHWDFHHGSLPVLTKKGWQTPLLLGISDDYSRLLCHAQWYLAETAENVAHALMQALQKRGVPRSTMSDNGSAMIASEIANGLAELGILHGTTLPYSPYQNGKQERQWGLVEGQLMAQLEDVSDLTLAKLNEVTQVWVEDDYHRRLHSEIGTTPIDRFIHGPNVTRPCPDTDELKLVFTRAGKRALRRNDGTVSIQGHRFEVPNRYRHITTIHVRYASWDLTNVHMIDEQTGAVLCRLYPLDKSANANGMRRSLEPVTYQPAADSPGMSPYLVELLKRRTATGLPPAYLPKDEDK